MCPIFKIARKNICDWDKEKKSKRLDYFNTQISTTHLLVKCLVYRTVIVKLKPLFFYLALDLQYPWGSISRKVLTVTLLPHITFYDLPTDKNLVQKHTSLLIQFSIWVEIYCCIQRGSGYCSTASGNVDIQNCCHMFHNLIYTYAKNIFSAIISMFQ